MITKLIDSYTKLYNIVQTWIEEYIELTGLEYKFKGIGRYDSERQRIWLIFDDHGMFMKEFPIGVFFNQTPDEYQHVIEYEENLREAEQLRESIVFYQDRFPKFTETLRDKLNEISNKINYYESAHC